MAFVLVRQSRAMVFPPPLKFYSTSFTGTEAPLSEGGAFRTSLTHGGSAWTDPQKGGGLCFGSQTIHSGPPFDDSVFCLATPHNANQFSQGTIFRGAGTANGQEVELFVLGKIATNNITGIEVDIQNSGTRMNITQWNGANGDVTPLTGQFTTNVSVSDAAVWRAEVQFFAALSKWFLTVKCNGVTVTALDITGNSLLTNDRSPGGGFYRDNNAGTPGANNDFCFTDWQGGELQAA